MEFFNPRKLKFKAWNTETKLLIRLHSIECVRGELLKKQHILLQFTGLFDQQNEELYDMDVLLFDSQKIIIHWNAESNGWKFSDLVNPQIVLPSRQDLLKKAIRLCNYFELQEKS